MKANQDIRKSLAETGLRQWQLADAFGIREEYLSRKLRKELPEEEKRELLLVIESLKRQAM